MALLGSPKLLILDEPTNGLDPAGMQEMRELIAAMPETTGATVLISSHLLGEMEQMVSQVGILDHGKMLFEGSLQELQRHSRGGVLLRVLDVSKSVEVVKRRGIKVRISMRQPDLLLLPPLEDEPLAALVSALSENGAGVVGVTAPDKESGRNLPESDKPDRGRWRNMAVSFAAELQKARRRHDLLLCLLVPCILVLWVGGLSQGESGGAGQRV